MGPLAAFEYKGRLLALVASMIDFPQVLQEDMIATYAHTTVGSYRGFNRAMTFGRTPGP
ncbi:hypothetical protein [Candidimonas sp. SYP-B2681]|uniref:hypothetical protein n=1 Tax=Candidimonas sp. SYP-B2681 TaxID=2497686 RepID=UPI0013155A96|nr:hypothetical protein [Candidimonas sp. SYP-B2681]